jgi:hypothetical protein
MEAPLSEQQLDGSRPVWEHTTLLTPTLLISPTEHHWETEECPAGREELAGHQVSTGCVLFWTGCGFSHLAHRALAGW